MRATSQQAVNRINRSNHLSAQRQMIVDEFVMSKRVFVLLLGVLLLLTGLLMSNNSISKMLSMPIERVDVRGNLNYVDKKYVQSVIASNMQDNYLNISLSQAKTRLDELPWVDNARIQRAWPNQLIVDISEQKPVALWSNKGVFNDRGEVFIPKQLSKLNVGFLPEIIGPEDEVDATWERYLELQKEFGKYNLGVRQFQIDQKGSQTIVLKNGIHVVLGSHAIDERLQRFFKVYKTHLEDKRDKIKGVDLRYANGVAVSWIAAQSNSTSKEKRNG